MALRPPLMASVQRNRGREKGNIEAGRDNATWGGKGGQKVGGRKRWRVCGIGDGGVGNEGVGCSTDSPTS